MATSTLNYNPVIWGKQPNVRAHSTTAATSFVAITRAAVLRDVMVTNNTGTAGWVQIHDAASLPADTAVPLVSFPLPSDSSAVLDTPVFVQNGAVIAISTTRDTLTISANAAVYYVNAQA